MKRVYVLAVILILAASVNAQSTKGVSFKTSNINAVLDSAKKQNKIVFINLWATWCGWCTNMKNNVFTQKEVGNYFNKNFISIRLNGEKGEGRKIRDKYGITAYPAMIFVNANGQLIGGKLGYTKSKELIELAKKTTGLP
jgi:thioredoxin-related protein